MVILNKIYTRAGDSGETRLGDGTRVPKNSLRVEAYGTVDELNSIVGLATLGAGAQFGERLSAIQNDLFDLGADLCRPVGEGKELSEHPPLRVASSQVDRLEAEIDDMNAELTPLRSFILPGGNELAAKLHQCRTVARRAERHVFALAERETVNASAVRYLNRLSDWFFVAARVANDNGGKDVLWVPGLNR